MILASDNRRDLLLVCAWRLLDQRPVLVGPMAVMPSTTVSKIHVVDHCVYADDFQSFCFLFVFLFVFLVCYPVINFAFAFFCSSCAMDFCFE